jgi:MarR family transcriptional regulator for hemolysin
LLRDLTRDLLLAGRLWRKMARHAASAHGVSEAASAPLIWIDRLGQNVRQTALADAIGIEGASLVRLLDELQSSGLITRVQDPTDRRANAVNLTERGRTVVEAVNETLTALRLEVFGATPRRDVEAAIRIFKTLEAASAKTDETA